MQDCAAEPVDPPSGALGEPCTADGTCDAGLACDETGVCVAAPPDPCAGVTCSGHGACLAAGGAAICVCDAGYAAVELACIAEPIVPPVGGCDAIAARWELCEGTATTCAAVFRDGAGCAAVCAAAGLACRQVYEDVGGSCAPDLSMPALGCDSPSGHQSDYCLCGVAEACVPSCAAGACGSDGCGGSCGDCVAECGNDRCDAGETCATCPSDCGSCCADGGPRVFPRAEGFGTCTPAGRGGQVIVVTTLADSGPGSLRAAVSAAGARTVVFGTSGRIHLASKLVVNNPYLTIAGQTAPSPGIQITGNTVAITTHDVLIQHLRVRVGDEGKTRDGSWDSTDAVQIYGTGAYNVVIDHVTANWSIDDVFDVTGGAHDVSLLDSIIAEPLNDSVHSKGAHGYVSLIAYGAYRVSYQRSLFGSAISRIPYIRDADFHLSNNLFYNTPSTEFTAMGGETITRASIVNNTYLDGPSGTAAFAIAVGSSTFAGSQLYAAGNTYDAGSVLRAGSAFQVAAPPSNTWPEGYVAMPEALVQAHVLANAGARPADRDAVETRLVAQVTTAGGVIVNSQAQVGGFPVYAVNAEPFDVGPDPQGDDDGDGYTNLEERLHAVAAAVEGR